VTLDAHIVFPWTVEEIREVLAAYRLGPLLTGPLAMPETGWDSQRARCRLRTATGAWFLKKHHPAVVRRESHALIRAFQREGGKAPEIMAQPNGETWLSLPDGTACEVHRLASGRPLGRPRDTEALEASEQLALWQRVPVELVPEAWTGWYDPSEARRLGPQLIKKLASYGLPTGELEEALLAEAQLQSHLQRPQASRPVHADLWRGNWVVQGDSMVVLTDFDWAHRGDRTDDLADLFLAMCTDRDTPADTEPLVAPPAVVDYDRMAVILRRYEALCGELSHEERACLPLRLRSYWVRHALWLLQSLEEPVHLRVAVDRTVRFIRALPLLVRHLH